MTGKKAILRKSPRPATRRARAVPFDRKPMKRSAWQPLREIVERRAPPSVRRLRPVLVVTAWQRPRPRRLRYYAPLIEATPTRQDTTAAVNEQARAEQRRIHAAEYTNQQAQRRAQWRQEADAIMKHWQHHAGHSEDVRRVKEGLRAEAKATDPGAPSRKLALYRQLAAIMGNG